MIPFKPMLAVPSTGASNRRPLDLGHLASCGGWVAEEKLDGLRAIVQSDGSRGLRIWNRSGVDITARFPEIARQRLLPVVLDGEIVPVDGTFQTVATRDKQTHGFAAAAKANPCKFVAFDLLSSGGQSLTHLPYKMRRQLLRGVIGRRRNIRPVRQSGDILGLWAEILAAGGEGVICKQLSSLYLPGERASSWVKFKAVQRITAVAVGYEKGVRREFGAMHLALIGNNGPIPIGKVGTGWTEKQGAALKRRLDGGDPFLIEVEALNRTPDNTLRFPVFRGERTDLDITAASADQLALLPIY